ncbi:MAG: hypothetical protein COA44_02245 [Arcobacter sp.]|nr:MAG: hypothetical protein COA44_02245 [Arcobacter sp.]
MKIDYISDTHFDEYLGVGNTSSNDLTKTLSPIFENKGSDVLIIAGDIGEHNFQNLEALRFLRDEIGYKHIIMVLGNHDWFLSNPIACESYDKLSINRVNEFKEMIAQEDGLYLLDGDIVKIDDIRFGGTMGWYDGSYMFNNLNHNNEKDRDYLQRLWAEFYPDKDLIYGCLETYDEFCSAELEKIEAIYRNCNVMITHINPSVKMEHTAKQWQEEDSSAFFSFDGSRFLESTSAKFWLFGHSHDQKEFESYGVQCLSNPLGSPGDNKNFMLRSFDVNFKNNV